ncbi:MAG: ribonuclease [Actinomycetota bacterium]
MLHVLAFFGFCTIQIAFSLYGIKQITSHRRCDFCIQAEMRILIHGTKNAYTTIRPNDVVFYKALGELNDISQLRLGVLTSDMTVRPLCQFEDQDPTKYFVDPDEEEINAEQLKEKKKLLRIVSSDRSGSAYIIEEYIDSDVYVPIKSLKIPSTNSSTENKDSVQIQSIDSPVNRNLEMEILKSQLEVAELRLKMLQLQQRELNALQLKYISSKAAPPAIGPYSHAVVAKGFIFASGCIGLDPQSKKLVVGGVEAEARQAIRNLESILKDAGGSLDSIVKITLLLQDIRDFASVNDILSAVLTKDRYPARTTFQAGALPLGAKVEIDAVAARNWE